LTDVKLVYNRERLCMYLVIYHFPGYASQETNTEKLFLISLSWKMYLQILNIPTKANNPVKKNEFFCKIVDLIVCQ
jgi:hypothetical protein